ncbi:MBL fold metallo-hydrolase [Shimazuella sp. AN120528]|uniref:MBL fold metallo-hydrolase n=1 Tax=Shimazuella soli TaxID=1892854 RepID=UPI001F117ADC|nr:MBL fold metallo-hydrolase [Shimazuella soli]MCH5584786.1 MBL fold metallo-hydrolase [Shimazuella soli]
MNIQLIRHATLWIEYAGKKLLIDPMFSKKGELAATPNTPNEQRNPLVDLSLEIESFLQPDAILLTHSHRDHLDEAAIQRLSKNLRIYCQPADEQKLIDLSFTDVQVVEDQINWDGLSIIRTGGQHGRGEIGKQMGAVSGFILQAEGEDCLYITGDTVWCEEVERAIEVYRPEVIVAFSGAAQFLTGGAITMDKEDLRQLYVSSPESSIVAVHLDTWNHCLLTRKELSDYLVKVDMFDRFHLPQDGEVLSF